MTHNAPCPFQIGDLAVPANGVVGPSYIVVDSDTAGTVTVAWVGPGGTLWNASCPLTH
jgi:hypothetical protein